MYALIRESGHAIWKEQWYTLTSRVSLQTNIYMTHEDQVFVVDVMVANPTWETTILNVISQPTSVATKLNTIINIRKYKGLHERHHFIQMAMKVHGTIGQDMDHFIKECICLFHNRKSSSHLSLSFCIQFFKQRVNISL